MQGQNISEEARAESGFRRQHQPYHLREGGPYVRLRRDEAGQLPGEPCDQIPLDLLENVLLGREMKVEGPARDTRGRDDRGDVGVRDTRSFELGHRRLVDALASLEPLRLASLWLLIGVCCHRTLS